MKYLKKSAEVLIGKAGVQPRSDLSDYTATLVLPTHYFDGSGEDLQGIQVTREHLEWLRNEIDRYLMSETTEDKPESESVELVNNLSFKAETGLTESQLLGVLGQVSQQVRQRLQTRNQQKQAQLVIDPKLMMVIQHKPTGEPDSWSAKIHTLTGLDDFFASGRLELSVLADSEENARERLNIAFHNFIIACIYPDSPESRIPDIVRKNQRPVSENDEKTVARVFATLNQQLTEQLKNSNRVKGMLQVIDKVTSKKTNEGWEARAVYWKGCNIELTAFGDTETEARTKVYKELIVLLQDQLTNFANHLSVANKPEDIKQVDNPDDKDSAPLKLNPSRVMSMKIGADKWEARTKLFSWTSDQSTDLVATADSEEAAREDLDKKFSNLAGPMMNFIKFMSQVS